MTIVQIPLDIPEEILAGLMTGEYVRHGGVVRDLGGHLVKLLNDGLPIDQVQEVARVNATKALMNPQLVVIGLGVVAAAAGGAFWANRKKTVRPSKTAEGSEELTCVEKYNTSLAAYLEAIRSGNLDADVVDRLIADLDEVKARSDNASIRIKFSPEQQEILVRIVVDQTRKLAEANQVELDGRQDQATGAESDPTIVDLRRSLEIQGRVLRDAA